MKLKIWKNKFGFVVERITSQVDLQGCCIMSFPKEYVRHLTNRCTGPKINCYFCTPCSLAVLSPPRLSKTAVNFGPVISALDDFRSDLGFLFNWVFGATGFTDYHFRSPNKNSGRRGTVSFNAFHRRSRSVLKIGRLTNLW